MDLKIIPIKCIGCAACEYACSFNRDEVFTPMRSSIMVYREEKKNYFGLILKKQKELVLGRLEGVEIIKEGEQRGGSGAKPILLRESCNFCDGEFYCVKFCPTNALEKEG